MKQIHKYQYTYISVDKMLEDGIDVADQNQQEFGSENVKDFYFNSLTEKQRKVADWLIEGYSRKDIARELHISIQAVHQIVLRIQNRLIIRVGVETKKPRRSESVHKNLVWIIVHQRPELKAIDIFNLWIRHPVLRDYDRPAPEKLKHYFKEAWQTI